VNSEKSLCRDCGAPTADSARSCPRCGILNPVVQWVAFPDGSHLTARAPGFGASTPGAAVLASPAAYAPRSGKGRVRFGAITAKPRPVADQLADGAIWSVLFAVLGTLVVGWLPAALVASVVTIPLRLSLPVRPDGRRLVPALSYALLGLAGVLLAGKLLLISGLLPGG
jgi:hypothetical protein